MLWGLRVGNRVPNRPIDCRKFTLIITYIYIYILLTTESIGHILMLLSIRVEAEFAEEHKEDVDGVRRLGVSVDFR